MRKILATMFVGLVAVPAALYAQVRIERPLTLQSTLQIQTAVVARYDSLNSFLQPTAQEKLAMTATMLQKEVAGGTAPDVVLADTRAAVTRQFPRMTAEQLDRMIFLALTAAVQADQEAQKDALGDLSTETSVKLQMYQERRSKFFDMLSNMMKKQSETSASIISNIK